MTPADTNPPPTSPPVQARPGADWHARIGAETVAAFDSPEPGLSQAEARNRLERFGPNRLTPPRPRSVLARFACQFNNVLIYVLIASAAATVALGHWTDSAVIVGVIVINALIGFFQEGKAEQALAAIRCMLSPQATVLREGARITLPAEMLVPGDRVCLESGDKVPADIRLVQVKGLRIQEAALTGESVPVGKDTAPVPADAALGDRTCMGYSGTLVTCGQGIGVVIATGDGTEIGRIGTLLAETQTMTTPLLVQMAGFGRGLTVAILALSAAISAFGITLRDYAVSDMVLAAVGIAVAAIPEGLPAVMTITLAIGVTRMARRNAIIRRLPSVETLGAVSVICSDKTGTLTRNELMVLAAVTAEHAFEVTGEGYQPDGRFRIDGRDADPAGFPVLLELARAGVLCNDAALRQDDGDWQLTGDPTDGALLVLGLKAGIDPVAERQALRRVDLIPFESEHKFMATLHRPPAGPCCISVKGAPEQILARCAWERRAEGDTAVDTNGWHERIGNLAREGFRVLAVAVRPVATDTCTLDHDDVAGGLTLLGLLGLIDPPREEAIAAVAACRSAGIAVKMITGDHIDTARAIGAQFGLGLDSRHAIAGRDLDAIDDHALVVVADRAEIVARAAPEHKLRLVRALQAGGRIVAMTGDGVNDAPALKRADVGIAMGRKGTEAAKEAAAVVLADDNFASIAHAVEEGRTIYDNLRKTILFLLPTNAAQAGIIVAAILSDYVLPITPVQILWVNMVTAVTLGLALAFEPPEADVMHRPPRRPNQPLIPWSLTWRIGLVTVLLMLGSFGNFLWYELRGASVEEARSIAVNTLVMTEIFYLLNARRILAPVTRIDAGPGSRAILLSIGLMSALQLSFTYLPVMQSLFGTAALAPEDWALMAAIGLVVFLVVEIEKAVERLWRNRWAGDRPVKTV